MSISLGRENVLKRKRRKLKKKNKKKTKTILVVCVREGTNLIIGAVLPSGQNTPNATKGGGKPFPVS